MRSMWCEVGWGDERVGHRTMPHLPWRFLMLTLAGAAILSVISDSSSLLMFVVVMKLSSYRGVWIPCKSRNRSTPPQHTGGAFMYIVRPVQSRHLVFSLH
jgi:hypothetical protein